MLNTINLSNKYAQYVGLRAQGTQLTPFNDIASTLSRFYIRSINRTPTAPISNVLPAAINKGMFQYIVGVFNQNTRQQFRINEDRWNIYSNNNLMWAYVLNKPAPFTLFYADLQALWLKLGLMCTRAVMIWHTIMKNGTPRSLISYGEFCLLVFLYLHLCDYGQITSIIVGLRAYLLDYRKNYQFNDIHLAVRNSLEQILRAIGAQTVFNIVQRFEVMWARVLCNEDLMYQMSMNAAYDLDKRDPIYIIQPIYLLAALVS